VDLTVVVLLAANFVRVYARLCVAMWRDLACVDA